MGMFTTLSLCSNLPFRHAISPFLRGKLFFSGREVKFYQKESGQSGRREDETEQSVAHVEREFRVSKDREAPVYFRSVRE